MSGVSAIWGLLSFLVVLGGIAVVLGLVTVGGNVTWRWLTEGNDGQLPLRVQARMAERQIEEIARRTDQAIIAEMLRRNSGEPPR